MITTRVFLAGPLNGAEQQVDATRLSDFYVIPQCTIVDDVIKYFSTAYRLDRDAATGKPIRDNRGRVIYRYSGSMFLREEKHGSWADISESIGDLEVAQ